MSGHRRCPDGIGRVRRGAGARVPAATGGAAAHGVIAAAVRADAPGPSSVALAAPGQQRLHSQRRRYRSGDGRRIGRPG